MQFQYYGRDVSRAVSRALAVINVADSVSGIKSYNKITIPYIGTRVPWDSLPIFSVSATVHSNLPVYQVRLDWLPLPCIALI